MYDWLGMARRGVRAGESSHWSRGVKEASWMNGGEPRATLSCMGCGGGAGKYGGDAELAGGG